MDIGSLDDLTLPPLLLQSTSLLLLILNMSTAADIAWKVEYLGYNYLLGAELSNRSFLSVLSFSGREGCCWTDR